MFKPLYKHLSGLANNTNDYLCVYSKLFFISDGSQQRLYWLKMLTIFKPVLRQVLAHNTPTSYQGALENAQDFVRKLEFRKKLFFSILSLSNLKPLERATANLTQRVPRKAQLEGPSAKVKAKT